MQHNKDAMPHPAPSSAQKQQYMSEPNTYFAQFHKPLPDVGCFPEVVQAVSYFSHPSRCNVSNTDHNKVCPVQAHPNTNPSLRHSKMRYPKHSLYQETRARIMCPLHREGHEPSSSQSPANLRRGRLQRFSQTLSSGATSCCYWSIILVVY